MIGGSILKRGKRVLVAIGCVALLLISWLIAISAKSDEEKQRELMGKAQSLMMDAIYVRAVPLLEEAAGYSTKHSYAVESELKKAYLALFNTHGYRSKYVGLLETQLGRNDTPPEVFAEAAEYYISIRRVAEALKILADGIERTDCEELMELYESNRYVYETNRTSYDYISAIHGGAAQVQKDGLWGMANGRGDLMIPCIYEQISTFSADRAIVSNGVEIFAVDANNNRVAKLHENASSFGLGFAENRFPLRHDGGWSRTTGEFEIGAAAFEALGMYSNGYTAAKTGGKWGVIDLASSWLVPAEYDEIICDELGRSFAQGAVFARLGDTVYLLKDGKETGEYFEDARPFSDEGYAAVKKNGKWGFIDTDGTIKIDFMFDDALSFGQHLAAVKIGDYWGYAGRDGRIAIEAAFLIAKSFSNGSAPVLTERGWNFITLIEYRRN